LKELSFRTDFSKRRREMNKKQVAEEILRLAKTLVGKELSEKQKKYQEYFMGKLDKYGVETPADMDEETKKKFFNEVSSGWPGGKD
jgi:uncharacterized membrane protein YheB (UPF0754 family)